MTDNEQGSRRNLAGLWEFSFLGKIDLESFDPRTVSFREKMPVPAAFDALPPHMGKRGAAVYRRRLSIPAHTPARLEFEAVSIWCRVYVDGRLLREHACGYAPFTVDLPPDAVSERELVVLVDNRFDFDRAPMHEEFFDFYQYGGIIRDVSLRLFPRAGNWVQALRVTPLSHETGEVEIEAELGGEVSAGQRLRLKFDAGAEETLTESPAEGVLRLRRHVPGFRVWEPQSPALHTATMTVVDPDGQTASVLTARFGIRTVAVREGHIELNGKPILLLGYNRHEWHPNSGPTTPTLQMVADLQLMKELGCNFIRGAHYPQNRRFLDLCDEMGFLVWEENLGWGQREKTFASARFRRDHAESLQAMLHASYNHPSVIIRGFLNESASDQPYVRPLFEETVAAIRKLDPSRLISYASMNPQGDLCYDLSDIVSFNLYPGWYDCEGVEKPLERVPVAIDDTIEKLDKKGWSHKPMLISEIGAEGLYGWHDAHHDFFTEEYQAEYLRVAAEVALANKRCAGIVLWHFSDARTFGGGWSLKRPRTFNNKGTFDEYRRPKLAARVVKEIFHRVEVRRPT